VIRVMIRKMLWKLDHLWGMAQYPFRKDALIRRLSQSMSTCNIETTNICNANCIFCAYQYQERPKGVMSMELFRKILKDYVECGGGSLGLTPTVGEPLADKHLIERIGLARSLPEITRISMYSNMISLDRIGADALVTSGLSSLTVSTSGFDREMYERVYRSGQYDKMLTNVLDFASANNKRGRPVKLFIDMRVDRGLREVYAYADYRRVVDAVGAENIGVKFRYDSWSGKITPGQLSGTMKLRANRALRFSPCSELYNGPMVYWDGKVGGCNCRDVNASELIIGDVNSNHLGEIWFGDELRKLREEFVAGKQRPICASCTHYNNLSHVLTTGCKPYLDSMRPSIFNRAASAGKSTTGPRVELPLVADL
jgi:MoaA/NifB/PqqE/SkfB family radical SAM enzyme